MTPEHLPWKSHARNQFVDVKDSRGLLKLTTFSQVEANIVLALANAHPPVERERRYDASLSGNRPRVWIVLDMHVKVDKALMGELHGPKAERHAREFAARLNAESAPPEQDGDSGGCELEPPTYWDHGPRCPFGIFNYPANEPPPNCGCKWNSAESAPSEPDVPKCPVAGCDKTCPHLHPSEPEVPERPLAFVNGHSGDLDGVGIDDASGRTVHWISGQDADDEDRAVLRLLVRAYNAEPKHERVATLAGELADLILGDASKFVPPILLQLSRNLQTELEKNDAE